MNESKNKSPQMIELVLDVETIKMDLENDFSEYEKEYLCKYDSEDYSFEDRMALYPETGKIAAIGGKNILSQKGFVVFQAGAQIKDHFEEEDRNLTLYGCENERELLITFWQIISSMQKNGFHLSRLITFNGKSFDVPFILMRSAANQIPIAHSLGHKEKNFHIDLLEECRFNRQKRRFSLDIIARTLGLESHRSKEYNGKNVWKWFEESAFDEIAFFCYEDVELTEKIYKILKKNWKIFF